MSEVFSLAQRSRYSGTAGLKRAGAVIRAEFDRRRAEGGRSPGESHWGYYKRAVYTILCHYVDKGWTADFKAVVDERAKQDPDWSAGRKPRVRLERSPFHWGVVALDDDINRDQVRRIASQLAYAHRNKVPEALLIGFLYQLGSPDKIYTRLAANRRRGKEHWFPNYRAELEYWRDLDDDD